MNSEAVAQTSDFPGTRGDVMKGRTVECCSSNWWVERIMIQKQNHGSSVYRVHQIDAIILLYMIFYLQGIAGIAA